MAETEPRNDDVDDTEGHGMPGDITDGDTAGQGMPGDLASDEDDDTSGHGMPAGFAFQGSDDE